MTMFTELLNNFATAENEDKKASIMTSIQNEIKLINKNAPYLKATSIRQLYTSLEMGTFYKYVVREGKEVNPETEKVQRFVSIEKALHFVSMPMNKGTKSNPSEIYAQFQKLYNLFWLANYDALRTNKTVSMTALKDSLKAFVDSLTQDNIYISKSHVRFVLANMTKEGKLANQIKDTSENSFMRLISKVVACSVNNADFDYFTSDETKNIVVEKLYF